MKSLEKSKDYYLYLLNIIAWSTPCNKFILKHYCCILSITHI